MTTDIATVLLNPKLDTHLDAVRATAVRLIESIDELGASVEHARREDEGTAHIPLRKQVAGDRMYDWAMAMAVLRGLSRAALDVYIPELDKLGRIPTSAELSVDALGELLAAGLQPEIDVHAIS